MKNLRIGFCLLLVLGVQIFAQKFIGSEPDIIQAGSITAGDSRVTGYMPHNFQTAALGKKNSSFANLMVLGGQDTIMRPREKKLATHNIVNSHGNVIGNVLPLTSVSFFVSSAGDTIHDNVAGGVVVLDSLDDDKKTAKLLFSSLRKLIVMQITISDANAISHSILKTIDLPNFMWEEENYAYNDSPGRTKRLALLGTVQSGADKIYRLAIGNPVSKSGSYMQSGRVDFFSLTENSWLFSQYNTQGLASGIDGLYFGEKAQFGIDLIAIDDLDKNGYNELAVLLPSSTQYPNSAIYIFFMDNEWTPSSKSPVIITGNSMPWTEKPEYKQNCKGLGRANWESENPRLLVACNTELRTSSNVLRSILIKNLVLNSSGNILSSSAFFEEELTLSPTYTPSFETGTNPLIFKNHKNSLPAVALFTNGPITFGEISRFRVFSAIDADYSKNFLLEAGKPEIIANLDSLFYNSGTSGFSANTLAGLVQCGIQNNSLLCEGEENAIGSWSVLELSSRSGCDAYRECKRKDTIFVYVRSQNESPNTALRIPKNIVIPFFEQADFSNLTSLAYFKNPTLQNSGISWNANGLKLSLPSSGNSNQLSIIPRTQVEGIDTILFNLSISASTDSYPVYLHIADPSKILENAVPANPGQDTVWNIAEKRYIALPRANSSGNIYTYDIAQEGLGSYAEAIGDYLRILKVDVADISVAYTENGEIKHRKITLMPEPKAEAPPTPIATGSWPQNMSVMHVSGGIQINGLSGELELRAFNFKGVEIQRERVASQGSVFIKLKHNTPQIVKIKFGSETVHLKFLYSPYGHSR